MKRITIAGGGLAGLSLGIALSRRGVPVLIREAGSYPRHRVCGEFVNGVTHDTLVNLGIDSLFEDALRHGSTRWWMGSTRILEARLPRPALGMSRWLMDERLRIEFENSGGELSTNDRVRREPADGLKATGQREFFTRIESALRRVGAEWLPRDAYRRRELHWADSDQGRWFAGECLRAFSKV